MENYTKEQCISWIKDPEIDPVTNEPFDDRLTFKKLLDKCKEVLTLDEVTQHNANMVSIIFPSNSGEIAFKIPDKVTYNVIKLTEEKKAQFNTLMGQQSISEEDLTKQINTDIFITKILTSERQVLLRKKEKYSQMSENPHLSKHLDLIMKRLDSLGSDETFTEDLIKGKRQQLFNIIEKTKTLVGDSRNHIKGLIYQKIFCFSQSPHISTNYILIGKPGTGKTKVAHLLSFVFYQLGLINTQNIETNLLSSQIESTIVLNGEENMYEMLNFLSQFETFNTIIIIKNDDKYTGSFLCNEKIKHRFPTVIYLTDYTGEELSNILFNHVERFCSQQLFDAAQILYTSQLIVNNQDAFDHQAKDMSILAQDIVYDFMLVLAQHQEYGKIHIDDTFKKFFLKKGIYLKFTTDDDMVKFNLTPVSEILPNMNNILISNLITHEQITSLIQHDEFINDIIKSKKYLLSRRLLKYKQLCETLVHEECRQYVEILETVHDNFDQNESVENVRKSLNEIIIQIDSIVGESRDNIRRMFYSQLYIFSQLSLCCFDNFMNYVIIGPNGSNKAKICETASLICERLGVLIENEQKINLLEPSSHEDILEHIYTFEKNPEHSTTDKLIDYIEIRLGLCAVIMTCKNMKTAKNLEHLFPNYLMILPYTSNDLYDLLLNNLKERKLSESQTQYIKYLIAILNENMDPQFDDQACDMIDLAQQIQDDMSLYQVTTYGINEINYSFQKFFYEKGYFVEFFDNRNQPSQTGGLPVQEGGGCDVKEDEKQYNISNVFNDIKKMQLSYYN